MDLNTILSKAERSPFQLWLLNFGLSRKVPFNAPHAIKIIEVRADSLKIKLPYKKSNLNHIKGIHACALATLCEYACGLALTRNFNSKEVRLIMRSLVIQYEKQAKEDVFCTFYLSEDYLESKIRIPLRESGEVFHVFDVEVRNKADELICTAKVEWQLKPWSNVRTKIEN